MAAKKSTKPSGPKKPRKPLSDLDKVTVREIKNCATDVHDKIVKLQKPELKFPERSLLPAMRLKLALNHSASHRVRLAVGAAPHSLSLSRLRERVDRAEGIRARSG